MSGFDDLGIFYADPFSDADAETNGNTKNDAIKKFKKFLREFQEEGFVFKYRENLIKNIQLKSYVLEVDLKDLSSFDENLSDSVNSNPSEYLSLFEYSATELAKELCKIAGDDESSSIQHQTVQITIKTSSNLVSIRDLKSQHVSTIVKVAGVVVNASHVRSKATEITIQCRMCRSTIPNIKMSLGMDGYALPKKCPSSQAVTSHSSINLKSQCPLDPFYIVPDKCKCVDSQILKLQELPDGIPTGEMPRHLQIYCDRSLVEKMVPGMKVLVIGIFSIKKSLGKSDQKKGGVFLSGLRRPYLRVVGIENHGGLFDVSTSDSVRTENNSVAGNFNQFTPEMEEEFRKFAARPDCYDIITRNIAPSIYGSVDIKKAIACLLFAGSRKRLPDGLTRRGDINVLLLGDPGTAKSQFLKFVEKVAPIGVYTSGKGSSAAGLTASVNREPNTRAFVIEGGAMVLADGGIVCIDEFDKMREEDRVAIHEAMEQQTISIAKAGITTTLNSRCAVLAAANSVFGRWDDTRGEENIDFMPTILSRFDMIFIIKDEHSIQKDQQLAKHVLKVHMNAQSLEDEVENEVSLQFLKSYVNYCRRKCGPRLSMQASNLLKHHYVQMRSHNDDHGLTKNRNPIYISVRQLEAIIRISESLAKMRLMPMAGEEEVKEAIRLFQVSTLDAASNGSLAGAEGFTMRNDIRDIREIETKILQRFPVGTQVSQKRILGEFVKQNYAERTILSVINILLRRGELQQKFQRRVLYRVR